MSGPSLADLPNPLDERVTVLNHHEPRTNGACYILCWLQQALRADDNPALDVAISLGNRMGLPVLVYHGLRMDYPHASDRLHRFILGASRDLQRGCEARGLRCATYVETSDHREKGLLYRLADPAALVVTDQQFVFVAAWQARSFAASCERQVLAVDCARLVPTRILPEGIKTVPAFRKASGEHRERFRDADADIEPTVPVYDGALPFTDRRNADKSDAELDALVASCAIDHTLPPSARFEASADAATRALDLFIEQGLGRYQARRNNAAEEDGVSNLSPYLHFGVLGPRRIARAVRDVDMKASPKWKFLDELLTWREWFHYMTSHAVTPEAFEFLPDRPRLSLLDHADDPRDQLYSLSALVHGETDDETWNAAQRQWLATGYMHNNLRMYWGKQLIKWTAHPRDAWITACYLNDRLSLDGRDPATYGNMRWVFGDARPAYREQPVYGWVAPKTDRGIRKRSGAEEWLARNAAQDVPRIAVPERAWIASGFGNLLEAAPVKLD